MSGKGDLKRKRPERFKVKCCAPGCGSVFDNDYKSTHDNNKHKHLLDKRIVIKVVRVGAPENVFVAASEAAKKRAEATATKAAAIATPGSEVSQPSTSGEQGISALEQGVLEQSEHEHGVQQFEVPSAPDTTVMTTSCEDQDQEMPSTSFDSEADSDIEMLCQLEIETGDVVLLGSSENVTESKLKLSDAAVVAENTKEILTETSSEIDYSHTFPFDPAHFRQKRLSDQTKKVLLSHGAFQPNAKDLPGGHFPKTDVGGSLLSFQSNWYSTANPVKGKKEIKRDWLSYSPTLDAAFCLPCLLFGKGSEQVFSETGYRNWKKAMETKRGIKGHEISDAHFDSIADKTTFSADTIISMLSDESRALKKRTLEAVKKNREILTRMIDIVILLAKQGLAYQGHDDSILRLHENKPTGNFLALVGLLAKYDQCLREHLAKSVANSRKRSTKTVSKKYKGRGAHVTFTSNKSQNKLISIIADEIKQATISEVKSAGLYSVSMDCTTDVSHQDQVSIVVRYLDGSMNIKERLLDVVRAHDATADGLFLLLKSGLETKGLSLKDCVGQSYDGASVMRGQYNGVRAKVEAENPGCLYIWTFDHVLNLVIMDACSSSTAASKLFGTMEALYVFFSESHLRNDELETAQRNRGLRQVMRLSRVSTTRWWSHQRAVQNVYFAENGEFFESILDALEVCQSEKHNRKTRTAAESLASKISSFEMVLTAHVFRAIFDITDPASKYLQSESIDLLQALTLVKDAADRVLTLRGHFQSYLDQAVVFSTEKHHLTETTLPVTAVRKKKRMAGELAEDEVAVDPVIRYEQNVFLVAIDTTASVMNERFVEHGDAIADFAYLNPKYFEEIRQKGVPDDVFKSLSQRYKIDECALRSELNAFASVYEKLKAPLISDRTKGLLAASMNSDDEDVDNSDVESTRDLESEQPMAQPKPSCSCAKSDVLLKESYISVLHLLHNSGVACAFPTLYHVYKILVTLPIGSTKCERCFSKLKIIKSRLRSTMLQGRLSSLIAVSIEKDLVDYLNYDTVIERFSDTDLLKKLLIS